MTASLEAAARDALAHLERTGRRRQLTPTAPRDERRLSRGGQVLVDFSSNDYLGLARDPALREAARAALDRYGVGAGASRLITGDHPLYGELEQELAGLKGTGSAVAFGSGYLANIGIIGTLVDRYDLVLADKLNHACLADGAALSGARVLRYPHGDPDAVEARLARYRHRYRHCLLVTDGIFSMDGDRAPLAELAELGRRYDAWLMTDDAHGLGVVGDGAGSTVAAGLGPEDVPLQMGTLSKAAASYGGYLCASPSVAEWVRNRARSFIYTTGLPPATVAASHAAIRRIRSDPALRARPLALAQRLASALDRPPPESPILPIVLGDEAQALTAQQALAEEGFLVQAIRPPTVPKGSARLRITVRAPHTEPDIDHLADTLGRALPASQPVEAP